MSLYGIGKQENYCRRKQYAHCTIEEQSLVSEENLGRLEGQG